MHLYPRRWLTCISFSSAILLLLTFPLHAVLPGDAPQAVFPQMPRARVGLIVDDFGNNQVLALEFLNLGVPLACAILPQRPWSRQLAQHAEQKGLEVMLHLPMEPHEYPSQDPGPLAVMSDMTDEEIRGVVRQAIAGVPGAIGVDNHMGSRVTEDSYQLGIVLDELARHNLFYVDSLTTPDSKASEIAASCGIPIAANRLFLDNERSTQIILRRLNQLGDIALRTGSAIGIAHVAASTLRALRLGIPGFAARGIHVVPISDLVQTGETP